MHIFKRASSPPMLGAATSDPWLGAIAECGKTVVYSATVSGNNYGAADCIECLRAVRHAVTEHGDCAEWCVACRREHHERQPIPIIPSPPLSPSSAISQAFEAAREAVERLEAGRTECYAEGWSSAQHCRRAA